MTVAGASDGPSDRTFVQKVSLTTAIILGSLIFLVLLWQAFTILLLVYASVVLAVPLAALTDLVHRRARLHRTVALILVVLVVSALIAGAATLLTPVIEKQAKRLGEELPGAVDQFESRLDRSWLGRRILDEVQNPRKIVTRAVDLSRMAGWLYSAVGIGLGIVFVAALAVYLAAEPGLYVGGILRLLPPERRTRSREVLHEMRVVLLRWLVGQGISMLVLGVLTSLMLWATGVPLALILGLFVAIMTFIPILGPIIASVPVLLLAAAEGVSTFLIVALLYLGIQQLEGNFLTPMIHRARIALPPVMILAVQLVLARLVGFLGILMAMPLVAIGMVAVRMLWVEDVLGEVDDDVPKPGGAGT